MQSRLNSTVARQINGRLYTAERVIEGTRKLRQHLIFRGHVEHDSKTYTAMQRAEMDSTMDLIFWQLLVRGWPGQSPLEPLEAHGERS
jgi:hypothetical protein